MNGIHEYIGALTYNHYELPNSFTEYVGANPEKHTTAFSYDAENMNTMTVQVCRLLFLLENEIAAFTQVQSLLWISGTVVNWFALAFAVPIILTVIVGTIRMVKANKEEIQKKC